MRRSTDRLHVRTLGPREREALEIIRARPGITVAELRGALGVGPKRIWQIIDRLDAARVRREPP